MDKDKIDIITKIATAAGALIAGIAIPVVINMNAEQNRKSQLYMQIMSQREQADSSLRERMFSALITSYFGNQISKDPEKQLMYLHLLSLNFQEFFDAKPLFEDLSKRLEGKDPKGLEKLHNIAQEMADKQINLLIGPDNRPEEIKLCMGEINIGDFRNVSSLTIQGKHGTGMKKEYAFNVELLDIRKSGVVVRVSPSSSDPSKNSFAFKTMEFEVSYYDMPFMNNTRLMDGSRFAFVLKNMDPVNKIAVLKVVTFPDNYMNLRDRPYFDEMMARLGMAEDGGRK